MNLADNAERIASATLERAGDRERFIIALAGPPGVGKSTLSEALVDEFARLGQGAAIVPMDGFHLDNMVLDARGQRDRKGAPFTFDAGGFAALLKRLRAETGRDVAIPVFDRGLDLARAGGRIVTPDRRILIAEGNYLLLDQPPWRDMTDLFDMTVMLTAEKSELRDRLVQRWVDHGLPIGEATARAMTNDIPNADLVINRSRHADIVLESSA
jgi:pantothenate kinase